MQISEVSLSATWQSTCITGYGGLLLSQLHVPHAVESKPGCVPVIKILPKRILNVGHSLEWFVRQNKEVGLEFMSVSIFFFLNPEIFLFEICVSKRWKRRANKSLCNAYYKIAGNCCRVCHLLIASWVNPSPVQPAKRRWYIEIARRCRKLSAIIQIKMIHAISIDN